MDLLVVQPMERMMVKRLLGTTHAASVVARGKAVVAVDYGASLGA